jgi:hypothetical protein
MTGNVCVTWQIGSCVDGAQISDFFIMAQGTWITSTWPGDGYASLTGTSMAAPVVAGAIAVLHQMWPHMKGRDLVALVLQTGDKNISGYAPHIHGQGLLDMNSATQPVGATGLPVSGRTAGDISQPSGGMSFGAMPAGLQAAFAQVMVLDSFERDFYVDLGAHITVVDTRRGSHIAAAGTYNGYAAYFAPHKQASFIQPLSPQMDILFGGGVKMGDFLATAYPAALAGCATAPQAMLCCAIRKCPMVSGVAVCVRLPRSARG